MRPHVVVLEPRSRGSATLPPHWCLEFACTFAVARELDPTALVLGVCVHIRGRSGARPLPPCKLVADEAVDELCEGELGDGCSFDGREFAYVETYNLAFGAEPLK